MASRLSPPRGLGARGRERPLPEDRPRRRSARARSRHPATAASRRTWRSLDENAPSTRTTPRPTGHVDCGSSPRAKPVGQRCFFSSFTVRGTPWAARYLGRRNRDDLVATHGSRDEPGLHLRAGPERDVVALARQVDDPARGVHLHADFRVALRERRDHRRERRIERRRHRHPQVTAHHVTVCAHARRSAGHRVERAARVFEKLSPASVRRRLRVVRRKRRAPSRCSSRARRRPSVARGTPSTDAARDRDFASTACTNARSSAVSIGSLVGVIGGFILPPVHESRQ